MKKLLFLGAFLVALASQPVMAQTAGPDVVVVQAYFPVGTGRVVISRGPGKTEELEFKNGFRQSAAAESYQQVIAKLYQEGYSIKASFGSGTTILSTLIFVKEK
jgi:hypothetical protein